MHNVISLVAFLSTLTILITYIDKEFCPWSGYFVIGGCFFFSFTMVGLLATDLSFTLKNQSQERLTSQLTFNSWMNVAWQIVYWSNFLFGTLLKTFYSKYWLSGHFSVGSKTKHALKQLAILIIIGVPVLVILLGLGYYLFRDRLTVLLSTILILLGNIQGMCILVLLLAYGLAFLPIMTWKRTNVEAVMYEHLLGAQSCYEEYRDARLEYLQEVSKCRDLASNYRTGENNSFLDTLV